MNQSNYREAFLMLDTAKKVLNTCEGSYTIHRAVIDDDIIGLRNFLDSGFSLNRLNRINHETLLHWVCKIDKRSPSRIVRAQRMNVEIMSLLLSYGADPNIRNEFGYTPLHLVVLTTNTSDEDESIVELLLKYKANVDAGDQNLITALMYASKIKSKHNIVKLLLKAGAEVNLTNKFGWSALFFACNYQNENMIELLLENGADPKLRSSRRKETCLHALATSKIEMNIPQIASRSHLLAPHLLYHGVDIDAQEDEGNTALHLAVSCVDSELIQYLLFAGARMDITNDDEKSFLDYALESSETIDNIEEIVLKYLAIRFRLNPDAISSKEYNIIFQTVKLKKYFDECTHQLTEMHPFMFAVLSKNLNSLAEYLNNENLIVFEENIGYSSYYNDLLRTRFNMVQKKRKQLDFVETLIYTCFESPMNKFGYTNLPPTIIQNICSNFSWGDLLKIDKQIS